MSYIYAIRRDTINTCFLIIIILISRKFLYLSLSLLLREIKSDHTLSVFTARAVPAPPVTRVCFKKVTFDDWETWGKDISAQHTRKRKNLASDPVQSHYGYAIAIFLSYQNFSPSGV